MTESIDTLGEDGVASGCEVDAPFVDGGIAGGVDVVVAAGVVGAGAEFVVACEDCGGGPTAAAAAAAYRIGGNGAGGLGVGNPAFSILDIGC